MLLFSISIGQPTMNTGKIHDVKMDTNGREVLSLLATSGSQHILMKWTVVQTISWAMCWKGLLNIPYHKTKKLRIVWNKTVYWAEIDILSQPSTSQLGLFFKKYTSWTIRDIYNPDSYSKTCYKNSLHLSLIIL